MARWVARSYIPWEPPTASATASSGALQAISVAEHWSSSAVGSEQLRGVNFVRSRAEPSRCTIIASQ